MRPTNWLGTRKQLAVVAVVLLVLTAGCLGLGGSDDTGSDELDEPEAPDENGDDGTDTDENGDDTDDGTDPGDREGVSATEALDLDDLDPVDDDVDADALMTDVADNLDALDRYKFTQQLERSETFDGDDQESFQSSTVVIDRAETRMQVQSEDPAQLGFLADGVYYEEREEYMEEYGSEWVKQSLDGQEQEFLNAFDTANELSISLDNATASLEGQTELEGEDVYVIIADVDEAAYEEFIGIDGSQGEYNSVEIALYVTQDSSELRIAEEVTDYWISSPEGDVDVVDVNTISFEYDTAEITLPEEAEDAIDLDEVEGAE